MSGSGEWSGVRAQSSGHRGWEREVHRNDHEGLAAHSKNIRFIHNTVRSTGGIETEEYHDQTYFLK